MKPPRQQLVQLAIKTIVLLAIYETLAWWLLEKNVVSTIFAAGPQADDRKEWRGVRF